MRKFITKTNAYLLERFPTLWNTRIVWVLASSLILHLLFFLGGYFILSNVTHLHDWGAANLYLKNGTVYMGIIISILQIVFWLIFLLKNNAFKNYYPTTRKKLWLHFLLYFMAFFICSTYYYSYTLGIKAYTAVHYPDEAFEKDVEAANKARIFFSHNIKNYTLNNLSHPSVLDTLHCETNNFYIQDSLPHFSFKGKNFQFYTLETKEYLYKDFGQTNYLRIDSLEQGSVYTLRTDSSMTCYFRDRVVDIDSLVKNPNPSYYNFSSTFYNTTANEFPYFSYSYEYPEIYYEEDAYTYLGGEDYEYYPIKSQYANKFRDSAIIQRRIRNMENQALLDRNDPSEIRGRLNALLVVADKYEIPHNLTTESWFNAIYHPPLFDVTSRIRTKKKGKNESLFTDHESTIDEFEKYSKGLLTEKYLESKTLLKVFENIDDIKHSNIFEDTIHIFIWICFFFASVLFAFRVSNIKTILFAIISAGILMTVFALVTALISVTGSDAELFIQYFIFFIATCILGLSFFLTDSVSKIVKAVAIALTLVGFVPYLLLIINIISTHQRRACSEYYYILREEEEKCFVLTNYLGENLSFLLFIVGIIFIYFFSGQIKKWKAQTES